MTARAFVTLLLVSTSLAALAGEYPATSQTTAPAEPGRASVRAACKTDIARFCQGVGQGSGRIKDCLKEHRNELSPECAQAAQQLKQAKSKAKASDPTTNTGTAQPQSHTPSSPGTKTPSPLDPD